MKLSDCTTLDSIMDVFVQRIKSMDLDDFKSAAIRRVKSIAQKQLHEDKITLGQYLSAIDTLEPGRLDDLKQIIASWIDDNFEIEEGVTQSDLFDKFFDCANNKTLTVENLLKSLGVLTSD